MSEFTVLKPISEIQAGEWVKGAGGNPVEVSRAYDVHVPTRMFEIATDDGGTVEVSGSHLLYVETDLDKSLFSKRKKMVRNCLKVLPKDSYDLLQSWAKAPIVESDEEKPQEYTLAELASKLGLSVDSAFYPFFVRTIESVGMCSQTILIQQVFEGDEEVEHEYPLNYYNARAVALELLKFGDKKRLQPELREKLKHTKPRLGRVITAEELFNEFSAEKNYEIPSGKA